MKNIFKIVFLIVGAFIGAGFASGKEIYTFFLVFGKNGVMGLVISAVLLFLVVYRTLNIINKNNINNYKDFLDCIIKGDSKKIRYIKTIINSIINILILISFFIMIAGFGAYFNQEYNINSLLGSVILAIFIYLGLKKDTKGSIKINEILVPIIIIQIIIIGIYFLKTNKVQIDEIHYNGKSNFIINSILYCSYNCMMLIPIIITINDYVKSKKTNFIISIISGIIVFGLSCILFFVLASNINNIQNIDMPIIYVLKNNMYLKNLYGISILLSITTTAISLANSFIKNITVNKKSYTQILKIMCITSIIISKVGFSNLINFIYPIFGILGIIQIIKLFI